MAQKKKRTSQSWIGIAAFVAIGGVCGMLLVRAMDAVAGDMSFGGEILLFAAMLAAMYVGIFLQIVIHEGGHLLFGLMTGYRFVSFRVGSMVWLEQDGRIVRKKFSLAGTGGQCLLSPPAMVDGRIPYGLYNLGGSLVNLVSALVLGVLAVLCAGIPILRACLEMTAVIGAAFAAINGIPLHMGAVNNDGCNALELGKDPAALRSFWVQMKVNELQTRGVSLRDMPEEWFAMPAAEEMHNGMVAVMGVLACNRLMAERRFAEADMETERILSVDTAIVGLHRSLLVCDRIYCACIDGRRDDAVRMNTRELDKFMKSMKTFPAVLRTRYALALAAGDVQGAESIRIAFAKTAETYPYPADAAEEQELMELVREKLG